MKSYIAQFNYFEITLPEDVVKDCHHSGPCDDDITNCRLLPEVIAELGKLDPIKLVKELQEYGTWNELELSNHDDNLSRVLWIACGNIQDETKQPNEARD